MGAALEMLKRLSIAQGYRFETNAADGSERMIRPDGSVAVIARGGPMPIVHSLTLEFQRELSPAEWRQIIDLARALPFVRQLRADSTGEEELPIAACLDCGLDYADFPMDLLLPRSQWLEIHPTSEDGGGLLCAHCMVARAAKLPGATAMHAVIEISPRQV